MRVIGSKRWRTKTQRDGEDCIPRCVKIGSIPGHDITTPHFMLKTLWKFDLRSRPLWQKILGFILLSHLLIYVHLNNKIFNKYTFVFFIKMKALTWHGMWCRVNLIWPLFIKYTKKIINDKMSLGLILYHRNRGGMDSNKILLQLIINLFFHYLTWRHWPSLWCGRPNPDVLTYMPPVFMTHSPSPPIWHGFMKSPYVPRRSDCFYAMGIHVLYII